MKMQATGAKRRLAQSLSALALAGLALAAVLVLSGAGGGGGPVGSKRAATERLLRLDDLGPGYFFLRLPTEGDEPPPPKIVCDRLRPADQQRKLAAFLSRYPVSGCFAVYARLFDAGDGRPVPHLVGTGAVDAGSAKGAAGLLRVAALTASHGFGDQLPREVPAPAQVGEEARLFHVDNFPILDSEDASGSLLAWRSGPVVGAVFVQGGSAAADDGEAVAFAGLQQQRLEHPSPYTPGERYDAEAGFEDPSIEVPVYWLGRSFAPGGGFPVARLAGALASGPFFGGLPGEKLQTSYGEGLDLGTWTAAGWQRFEGTRRARELTSRPCTRTARIPLVEGTATLYAAYGRDYKRCPPTPPIHHFAVAELGGAVVAVNLENCPRCHSASGGSPYNSAAAMRAIVRALKPRVHG